MLQAGGFGVVAIDLADVPPRVLKSLPFTTWLRLQRIVEGSDTACLLVTPEPLARSAGGLTVMCTGQTTWSDARSGLVVSQDWIPRFGLSRRAGGWMGQRRVARSGERQPVIVATETRGSRRSFVFRDSVARDTAAEGDRSQRARDRGARVLAAYRGVRRRVRSRSI